MTDQTTAPTGVVSSTELGDAFQRLLALPAGHDFWKNKWMFTKPVFMNESTQGTDQKKFWIWAIDLKAPVMRHILSAPNTEGQRP
jgi:hypothetical protein